MESYVRTFPMSSFLDAWEKFWAFWIFVEKTPEIQDHSPKFAHLVYCREKVLAIWNIKT